MHDYELLVEDSVELWVVMVVVVVQADNFCKSSKEKLPKAVRRDSSCDQPDNHRNSGNGRAVWCGDDH